MFKNLGNLASVLKQAREMQGRMQEVQENLRRLRVEGSAGGGMVRVEASGTQQILAVHVEDSLMNDREMLEDLLIAATNQALEKARDVSAQEMQKMAGGLEIPGLNEALSKLGLGGEPASEQ